MTTLQMEKELLQNWQNLPDEKRQEAFEFVRALGAKTPQKTTPLRSALGLCADLRTTIEAVEINEARQELWGAFPQEDF